ncbi:MAG TPA: ArdC family protein, partial [Acidimicrobiales bacterium]|nr:ArdC family protein [Acidimicrobiales bacterium]
MSATVASTDKADKVRELHERLVAQVEALVTGEDWARYLSVAARFHSYSANNLWLILAQRPDLATTGGRVAGYQTWKRLGRQVQAGSKGIAILAPCVYRRRGAVDAAPTTAPADSTADSTT